jgi:hypothetical protein
MRELPFPIPRVRLAAQWHHISRDDAELTWFLGLLRAECDAGGTAALAAPPADQKLVVSAKWQ